MTTHPSPGSEVGVDVIGRIDYLIECYQNAAEYMKETPVGVLAPATIEAKEMRDAVAKFIADCSDVSFLWTAWDSEHAARIARAKASLIRVGGVVK